MQYQGRITNWKDDRGFGFITPRGGGAQVFVHINSFTNRSQRPNGNELVIYKIKIDEQGRPQAQEVQFVIDRASKQSVNIAQLLGSSLISATFIVTVAILTVAGMLPNAVLILYLLASAATFLAYLWDKVSAQSNAWRTPEDTLHFLGLVGGWPGALVARHVFRHKSNKQSFIAKFWAIVALNCVALAWMLSPPGQRFLVSLLGTA